MHKGDESTLDIFNNIREYILMAFVISVIVESSFSRFKKRSIIRYSKLGKILLFFAFSEIFVLGFVNIFITQSYEVGWRRNLILGTVYCGAFAIGVIWNRPRRCIDVYGFTREDTAKLITEIFIKYDIKCEINSTENLSKVSIIDKKASIRIIDKSGLKKNYISINLINFHLLDNATEIFSDFCNEIERRVDSIKKVRGLTGFIICIALVILLFTTLLIR